ncbi:MAG: aminodeoxychorismate/anthranilate synthase component II [Candidatus Bipolaricaulia bacterium]
MIVVIDNYDSFTYNLVQYFGELGASLRVFRNDAITVAEIEELKPDAIILSPGPGRPEGSGVCLQIVRELHERLPILGVCLGHQAIAHVFGGTIDQAPRLMHGKTSAIHHTGQGIFASFPSPFTATRYHSLIVKEPVPDAFDVTAFTAEGEIMAIQHREHPLYGVQFHPESILTPHGKQLLESFLRVEGPNVQGGAT